jgi:osmoprotectant transport system permease protein
VSFLEVFAQVQIHRRTNTCENQNGFCPDWIVNNFSDRYVDPLFRHLELVLISVAAGFVIAFTLGIVAHRRRWLVGPIVGVTGVLYTIPSVAAFLLLIPITGFGLLTAVIALTAYTLLIIFRNVVDGLNATPDETRDAARGMGLTENQVLWRVEVPLALPEIFAGVRIATTTTVGLAALAFFAGAGGLGGLIFGDLVFKSNVVVAGGLCILIAFALDGLLLIAQRLSTPWVRARRA